MLKKIFLSTSPNVYLFINVLIALLAILIFTNARIVYAADWTDFGGDDKRQHRSTDPLSPPVVPKWSVQLGRSSSQPLIVGDKIYVLAGDSLWCLNGNAPEGLEVTLDDIINGRDNARQLVIWRISINEGKVSKSHPVYHNGIIYLGTGGGRVAAVDAETGQLLGQTGVLAPEVVSAPLVFESGEVVVGTSDGYVRIIRGLQNGNPTSKKYYLGGRVTSSPIKLNSGNGFIIADDGGQGVVKAFYINDGVHQDFDPVWPKPIKAGSVPASFAKDLGDSNDTFYFSTKNGKFFQASISTGGYLVNTKYYNSVIRINNSPAVGSSYVYFNIRRSYSGSGELVAVDKSNWFYCPWSRELENDGNTAPLVWQSIGGVLVGDTRAKLYAFNSSVGGEPLPFAPNPDDPDGELQPVLDLGLVSQKDPDWWRQTTGVATELTLASGSMSKGLLLFGANYSLNLNDGWLFAYSTGQLKNLLLKAPDPDDPSSAVISPEGPIMPETDEVTLNIEAEYQVISLGEKEPQDTYAAWKFDIDDNWRGFIENLHFEPESPNNYQILEINTTVPIGATKVIVNINPDRNMPQNEMNWEDNVLEIPLDVILPNLKIENMQLSPLKPEKGGTVNLSVDVINDDSQGFNRDLVTDLSWWVDGELQGTRTNILVPAGGKVKLEGFSFTGTESKHTVKFFVNPNKTKPIAEEIYPADNIITRNIYFTNDLDLYVANCQGGQFKAGETVTLTAVAGSTRESVKTVTETVEFIIDGKVEAQYEVTLAPGEEVPLNYQWTAPNKNWDGELRVVINRDINPGEITYANNVCISSLRVREQATSISCLPGWIDPSDPYCEDGDCRSWSCDCDENGSCDCCCSCDIDIHNERISLSIHDLTPDTVKAGMGFTFTVETNYDCNDCSEDSACGGDCEVGEDKDCPEDPEGGATEVVAFFPEGFVGIDYKGDTSYTSNGYTGVRLIPDKPRGSHNNTWKLPRVVIEPSDIKTADRGEDIKYVDEYYVLKPGEIEGGHKHYTPFPTPDGPYSFVVVAWGGSEGNNIVDCKQATVTIKGSPYDDFVVRRVDPHNPFPAGTGWNWKDKVSEFFTEELKKFWDSFGNSHADHECWWTFGL